MMKRFFYALAAVFALTFISGCFCVDCKAQASAEKEISIFGNWAIEDLPSATAKKIKPAPNAGILFRLENGSAKVNGCAGDNRFFGNVKIEGRKLIFSHMGMTRMLGPNAAYEGLFMEALNQVTQFDVKNGKLLLLNKDGKTLMIMKPVKK